MSAFKLILKRLIKKTALVMVFTFLSTTVIKGQESVLSARPYKIVTDTITKIDTTYVIDTIINT